MKLSKCGYGSVEEILEMPVNIVVKMLNYENFCVQFENEFQELNRK